MKHLELTKLLSYDDAAIIAEIRRVVALLPPGPVTVAAFDRLSKVHSTTLRNRFGGWRLALAAAGIDERFNDSNARRTRDEVIEELKRVASGLGKIKIGRREFEKHSRFKSKAVCTAFGTFPAALQAAGLAPLERHDRSDEECFENILTLWSHHGRAPTYGELNQPPSQISGKVYARRWGGWRKALGAFMEKVNNVDLAPHAEPAISPRNVVGDEPRSIVTVRSLSVSTRYRVLCRDRFRCVLCGSSPATNPICELHVFRRGSVNKLCHNYRKGKTA